MTQGIRGNRQDDGPGVFPSPLPLSKMDGFLHLPSNTRLTMSSADLIELTNRRVAFLDRDGVLVEDVDFITSPKQLNLLPGVGEALRILRDRFFTIVITNQSGIARGLMTEDDLLTIHMELVHRLHMENVTVDAFYYCPHHPSIGNRTYGIDCQCRKPRPGMLTQAESDWDLDLAGSFMVGDRISDIVAADAAGIKGVFLQESLEKPGEETVQPFVVARNLLEAARLVLAPN